MAINQNLNNFIYEDIKLIEGQKLKVDKGYSVAAGQKDADEEKIKEDVKKAQETIIRDSKKEQPIKDRSQIDSEEIVCKILTLSNSDDLSHFNYILKNKYNYETKKGSIIIDTLDKQYNEKLNTWQIFIIYKTLNFKTINK